MGIKDRIQQFLDYKQITRYKFERQCGLPVSSINNMGVSIGTEAVKKIINGYPEINLEWLVLGTGPMIKNEEENLGDGTLTIHALSGHIKDLQMERDRLLEERDELKDEIDRLRGLLNMEPLRKKEVV